jgi:hypothetical protein
MKAKSWMAGIAAVATLFAAMTAPASAMAEEKTTPSAPQTSENCAAKDKTITVQGEDADAFKTWTDNGKTPSGIRTFKVAKVADYKLYNDESGGLVHLETVNGSKPRIIQAVKALNTDSSTSLYVDEDHDGDPMNWLANTKNDMLIRRYAEKPGVDGTALDKTQVNIDETNKTMTLAMPTSGLYVIFDDTTPKQQTKDTGDNTVAYDGFNNMLVGTPLTDGCKVTNNDGVVDLTSGSNAKTSSTTTERGGFKFTKVGVEGDRSGLAGAEFTVYSDENFTRVLTDANGKVVRANSSEKGGLVDFSNFKLDAGTYYLKETKVPDGYWSGSAAKLKVTMTNVNGQVKLESITVRSDLNSVLLSNSEKYGYVYRNIKSITQLPLTGAMGMAILGVVAVLCIGGASIIIVRARKTKRSFVA